MFCLFLLEIINFHQNIISLQNEHSRQQKQGKYHTRYKDNNDIHDMLYVQYLTLQVSENFYPNKCHFQSF